MQMIAHRGGPQRIAAQALPENSLAAISHALEIGASAIEIDVYAVAGELWVAHDRVIGRTFAIPESVTEVALTPSLIMTEQSYEALAACRLSNGEPIPRLSQVLALVGDKAELNIEIKGPDTLVPVARTLVEFVRETQGSFEQYALSSFDHRQLHQALLALPQVRRGVLIEGIPLDVGALCDPLRAYSLNTGLEFFSQELLDEIHARGLKNWVYTVNRESDWRALKASGVDAIFTDRACAYLSAAI